MKAAMMTSNGFVFEEVPVPKPGKGEVLIKSISCGVCEGEVYRYRQMTSHPGEERLLLGHEGSGTVAAIGEGVLGWALGDVVTTSLGGAYAEYFVVAAERLLRLPKAISPEWAVGEAVACCAYSAKNARIEKGDAVAVVGCGFMGMLCIDFAKKLYGAGEVLAIEPVEWRLALASCHGADSLSLAEKPEFAGRYDVVLEAAGVQAALDASARMVAEHGRLTIVGYHQSDGGSRSVPMQIWNLKALEVTSGHCRKPLWKKDALQGVLPLIASGEVDVKGLVTPYPFESINQAFLDVINRKPGLMKAAVLF